MNGNMIIKFEESNYDILVEKFLNITEIRNLWENFVYEQYKNSLGDIPDRDL